jgi:hypothetical protein
MWCPDGGDFTTITRARRAFKWLYNEANDRKGKR